MLGGELGTAAVQRAYDEKKLVMYSHACVYRVRCSYYGELGLLTIEDLNDCGDSDIVRVC